ncbi:uncharacterized protein LOC122394966 [Colletes gigas]|uniref:uncharacterized protein LOC122394966 n=1 Tax=Colletes gigas TaxID=935657 RepID=UPI001C9AC5BA|nr:uncharacterized protein LOC122394966 [Colletes gigas]
MEEHFATLKLLDSDTDCKLTKAVSYSELPSSRRVHVEKSYFKNPSDLIRQYSCEQIFYKNANTRQLKISEVVHTVDKEYRKEWQATIPYSDTLNAPNWPLYKPNNVIQSSNLKPNERSNEIEYMEIDNVNPAKEPTSTNTNPIDKQEPVPCPESRSEQCDTVKDKTKTSYSEVKKNLRSLVPKKEVPLKKKINMCYCNLACLCITPIIVGIIALFLNPVTNTFCNRATLFSNATTEMQQKIYGQTNAISDITYALNQDIYHLKVVCLIGGTGVGKSYTVEIIKKNFPHKKRILTYDLKLEDKNKLTAFDSYELLIIENLKLKNLDIFATLLDILVKNKENCVTVFAIFNVEGVDDYLEREVDLVKSKDIITKAFIREQIDLFVVPYIPLSEQALEMCIMDVARQSDLQLSQDQINEIKHSLSLSGSGCKGAYAKTQIIGRE